MDLVLRRSTDFDGTFLAWLMMDMSPSPYGLGALWLFVLFSIINTVLRQIVLIPTDDISLSFSTIALKALHTFLHEVV